MQVRILGCGGGIGSGSGTTSLLIGDDLLVDAGTGMMGLPLASLKRLRHVFLTHSHMDHIAGLPLLVDTLFDTLEQPLVVHGRMETLAALTEHIFNWELWPDFTRLPDPGAPAMRYHAMAAGEVFSTDDCRLEMIGVNHSVPGAAYVIAMKDRVFAFSGDTASNDTLWEALNRYPRLDALMIETAFPNRQAELAEKAGHYCPATLAADLAKLRHDPDIYISHLKPGSEECIFGEICEALPDRRVHRLMGGELLSL